MACDTTGSMAFSACIYPSAMRRSVTPQSMLHSAHTHIKRPAVFVVNSTQRLKADQSQVPGSILAAVLVLGRFGGRKTAMSFFTVSSGIFLFGLTAARTPAQINGLTCAAAFMGTLSASLNVNRSAYWLSQRMLCEHILY